MFLLSQSVCTWQAFPVLSESSINIDKNICIKASKKMNFNISLFVIVLNENSILAYKC